MKKHTTTRNANTTITHVGLDVHQDSITVAILTPGAMTAEVFRRGTTPANIAELIRDLKRRAPDGLHVCYEAGPTGYGLQRRFAKHSVRCDVIAPSMIPVQPGARVKTDPRDAIKLAELLRDGQLAKIVVHPPNEAEEAVRDLCRAREACKRDQLRTRHRVHKLLLRRSEVYRVGKNWTKQHRAWLNGIRFDALTQMVLDDLLMALDQMAARLESFDEKIAAVAQEARWQNPAAQLRCFRGIDTLSAMGILSEAHDIRRFATAGKFMAYNGLIPSEDTSGPRERRGDIFGGNGHLRRILVESAWHYRHPPRIGKALAARRKGQPAQVIARADRMMHQGKRRFDRLGERGKPMNKIVCAVARMLSGALWAILQQEKQQQQSFPVSIPLPTRKK
jgi:transposase